MQVLLLQDLNFVLIKLNRRGLQVRLPDRLEDALRAEFRSTPWADRLVDGVLRRE